MKKSILFVIDSLYCAGAEKSLTTLLNLLDYKKYSVDLMLFAHGGEFENLLPEEVNILNPLNYTKFTQLGIFESLLYSIKALDFKMFYSRIRYSINRRKGNYSTAQEARIYWQSVSGVIESNQKDYDIAISYAQGIPTFYVAEKVNAKKKIAWVNSSYRLKVKDKGFQSKFYDHYNKIVAVSDSAKEVLLEMFPNYFDKVNVIYDINNPHFISSMAKIGNSYGDFFDGIRILTIGRLANEKGYDIALKACKMLKEKNVNFRWYVLGKGPLKKEIEELIKEYDLTEHFILLGVEVNPYPFINNANIYVQTSRSEGFGLAIAEARMLNIPVITTRFDAVYNQMVDGKNGLVVDMNAGAVSDNIIRLINDNELKQGIVDYLKSEKKGNIEEIEKFYQLIG